MTGFLDRLLHADKPQPLDVDTAAPTRIGTAHPGYHGDNA